MKHDWPLVNKLLKPGEKEKQIKLTKIGTTTCVIEN